MLHITRVSTADQMKSVRELVAELSRWDVEESQRLGVDPQLVIEFFYQGGERTFDRESVEQGGELLLATLEGMPAGCAGYHRFDAASCELCHLYVRPEFRGRRVARGLVEALVEAARAARYRSMKLETAVFMRDAQKLYESLGFARRSLYREVLKPLEPLTIAMEQRL